MLRERAIVTIILLPLGLYLVSLGGMAYLITIIVILGLAAWEYNSLFRAGGFKPTGFVILGGVVALLVGRYLNQETDPFGADSLILSATILIAMTVHMIGYERGDRFSGTDFAVTVSGVVYIGFLGGYLIPLRALPDGFWWFLAVLPAIWLADSGAYFVGKGIGRHRFSPRLSPKKTWEGYIGGVVVGTLGNALLTLAWRALAPATFGLTPFNGALLGLALAVLTPLGDLGQSMLKRQVGVKDSSHLIPGHGGVFDRIDSWIWAAVIGYYLIVWFFI